MAQTRRERDFEQALGHVPIRPRPFYELLREADAQRLAGALAHESLSSGQGEEYLHGDTLMHLSPLGDLTHEEWWLQLKMRDVRVDVPFHCSTSRAVHSP